MRAFIVGVIVGIVLVAAGVYVYFAYGYAPAAVEDKPMPFENKLANTSLHVHIDREMPKSAPIPADETTFMAGAQVYDQHCGICHGYPNMDQSAMSKGMFPKPPQLFKGKGVTDDPPGETFWKVENGIRLTGMPEFKHILNETQMWQISLLLANADKISDAVKQELKPPAPPAEPAPTAPAAPRGAAAHTR